ncbi:MAG: hypothetical protein WC730_03490 [Patescibacteria group bacterium]|jgi:hypothetical protein
MNKSFTESGVGNVDKNIPGYGIGAMDERTARKAGVEVLEARKTRLEPLIDLVQSASDKKIPAAEILKFANDTEINKLDTQADFDNYARLLVTRFLENQDKRIESEAPVELVQEIGSETRIESMREMAMASLLPFIKAASQGTRQPIPPAEIFAFAEDEELKLLKDEGREAYAKTLFTRYLRNQVAKKRAAQAA